MSPRPIHVVIVAFGPPETLRNCLQGLEGAFPCLVVDNGSSPEVHELCLRFGARYLDPGGNLGFAAGVNLALAELQLPACDVLLLNPDAIVEPSVVNRLHDVLHREPGVACVAPAQRGPEDDRPDPIHRPFPSPLGACLEAIGLFRLRRRSFVVGSVLLINGAALVDLGGLDERFFLYGEEADWEFRARRGNWRNLYCPEVVALHEKGGTDPDPRRRELRVMAGHERFVRKWYGAAGWHLYRLASAIGYVARVPFFRGDRRRTAALRAHLLLRGPDRLAQSAGVLEAQRPHVPSWAP